MRVLWGPGDPKLLNAEGLAVARTKFYRKRKYFHGRKKEDRLNMREHRASIQKPSK